MNSNSKNNLPRERIISRGAEALTDAELIAVVLRTGNGKCSVVDFAEQLLKQFGGLRGLLNAGEEQLMLINGLGTAKVAALQSTRALGTRYLRAACERRDIFNSSASVRPYLQSQLCARYQEIFAVLLLDSQNRLIQYRELFFGTIDSACIHPREVLRCVIEHNAGAVIFAHNHPSGMAEPSQDDIDVTLKLKRLLSEIGVRVLDHIIVGSKEITSFADRGLL
ncbi:MAG: DNA repair protein RadC [Pseudomonadales bacterium]|nr:DNA repair protein RadC [Pseudomonadales bacterium]